MRGVVRRRAARTSRARAALAWGLAFFFGLQGGVRLWLERAPELGEPEFGRKLNDLRAALAANPGRPLLLMLGSSRVATGFRPAALSPLPTIGGVEPIAYNFALVGTGPEMSHLVLHRLLAAGIRPAWVFVEYWPPFWCTERKLKHLQSQVNLGRLDLAGIRLLGGYTRRSGSLYSSWITAQVAPLFSNRTALLRRFAPDWVSAARAPGESDTTRNLDATGWWNPRATRLAEYDRQVRDRMLAHYAPVLEKFQSLATPDSALRGILALCRRERIRATVIVLPEGDLFRNIYPPRAIAEVEEYLDRLRGTPGAEVIDARRWVAESDFIDSHHLFPEGATEFTRQLGRELSAPMLARRQGESSARSRIGNEP